MKDGKEGDRGVIFLADAGLPPLPGVRSQSRGEVERENEERFRLLARDTNVDSVVIGAEWGLYFRPASGFVVAVGDSRYRLDTSAGRELARVELEKLLSGLVKDGKRVYNHCRGKRSANHRSPGIPRERGCLPRAIGEWRSDLHRYKPFAGIVCKGAYTVSRSDAGPSGAMTGSPGDPGIDVAG